MGIAAGKPIEMGRALENTDPYDYISKTIDGKFDGYVCVTVSGRTGIEDGTVMFEQGKIALADYEYFKYNTKYKGEEALKRVLNAFTAKVGVIDKLSLTPQQIKLVLSLKSDSALSNQITKKNLSIPGSFSFEYEEILISKTAKNEGNSREEMLKKYGLTGLKDVETDRDMLLHRATKETEDIRKMVDKK